MTEKEKILASAQKFLLKGNLDRAIKEYQHLTELDSRDMRHRQYLAELLARANRKDEAVQEFVTVASSYADNGYYLKAISVYKQIRKLTPQDETVPFILADLYEKQGLLGNALAECQAVLLSHEQSGEYGKAVQSLDRMVALDPENSALHLQLAETSLRADFPDRAYSAFLRTALLLKQNGDAAGYARVCARLREVFPERTEYLVDMAGEQIRSGKADLAVLLLREIVGQDPANVSAWFLLAEAYEASGDPASVKDTHALLTVLFPGNPEAREKYISSLIADGALESALLQLETCLTLFPAETLAPFEVFFLNIAGISPDNLRPFLGLRQLYATCGQSEKLAEMELRLELLGKARDGEGKAGSVTGTTDAVTGVGAAAEPQAGALPERRDEVMPQEREASVETVEVTFFWEDEAEDLPELKALDSQLQTLKNAP